MSLSKKVVLTVSGYKISLSDSLQFYQNDQLKLIFEINKYGIDVASSFTHKTLMPLQPLTATLFIETPLGVDSIESANIEDNAVTFYLTSNQTQHIGTSSMQIKLTDDDGCQITLPSFAFEVQKNIYDNAVHVSGILLADENGNVLSDENGNTVNATATTETSKQIKDFTLKTGVSGQEDILVQDNGVTKRIKSSELIDSVDLSGYATETFVTDKIAEASLAGGEVDLSGYATTEYVDREVEKTNAQLSKIFNKTVEINVRDFGAKGDGVTDDSQAIRKAIESLPKSNWKLIFPPGTYVQGDGTNPHYTNANGSYGGDVLIGKPIYFEFNGMSNFAIEGYGATIIAHPENSCIVNNRGFSFIRCTNGEIKGLTYNGNIENRRPWGGDDSGYNNQCGFTTSACSYLTFEDCNAYGCVMDGFFIGADGRTVADYSNHIKLIRCQSLRNYRQGLSVVNGHYGVLEDCVFAETGTIYGTSPKAGVDMEQGYTINYEDRGQKCWSIKRCTFRDNAGGGLVLHWGTHFATVDDCKFERNSLACYSDSEYRTRDNQITNCTFIDASISLGGGGVLFQKNRCYNTNLSVGDKDLYSLGITRRNEISDNLFRWDWNLEDETITNKIIETQRRLIFTSPDIIFTRNTLINPTGGLILYCSKKIHEISHNTITSTKDLSSNCDYFGTLKGVSATILKDNYVSSQYQHYDKSYLNCFLESTNPTDRLFLLQNFFNIGENHRIDIRICKTSMIIPGMTIHIRFSKNEHYVVTYITPNNQTIRKISGEMTNPFEIAKVYVNDDGYSYTTLRPTSDYNTGVFELELEYPRFYPCSEADSFGFTSERGYVDSASESLVFYKPLLGNVKYSSLPTTDEWLIHEGTQIFYNKLPVWFDGSNWIKADGTIV